MKNNNDGKRKRGAAVACTDFLDHAELKRIILTNLALGKSLSGPVREAVERSNTNKLREIFPHLLGHKRKQAAILDFLERSGCGCPGRHHLSWGRRFVIQCRTRIVAYISWFKVRSNNQWAS